MSGWVEPVSFAIVVGYLLLLVRRPAPARAEALRTFGLLAVAGWVGEATCIHGYGFYAYSPGWRLWLDVVPLCVVVVWPVVILSALELASSLLSSSSDEEEGSGEPSPFRSSSSTSFSARAVGRRKTGSPSTSPPVSVSSPCWIPSGKW